MIFISYSSKDQDVAIAVKNAINDNGVKTWFAKDNIEQGKNYAGEIAEAIKEAAALVLVLSKDASCSKHVERELELAIKHGKPIYPMRIDNKEPSGALEYFLAIVQYTDVSTDENSIKKYISNLIDILGLNTSFESEVTEKNIAHLCIKHFKSMGFKIYANNAEQLSSKLPAKSKFWHKNTSIELLASKVILANKSSINHFIVPIFLDYATPAYFKTIEAELFWEYRFYIWHSDFIEDVAKELKFDANDENLNFIDKSKIVDYFRSKGFEYQKNLINIPILFYLFVKNPPQYEAVKYTLPFRFKYNTGEKLPNLFLNFSMLPNWWGTGKDDIDGISKSTLYDGFLRAYKELMKSGDFIEANNDLAAYENYNGRLAETLCEIYLKKHQLIVQRYGVEHLFGNSLSLLGKGGVGESSEAITKISRFMSSPDFLALKLNDKEQIVNSYFFDAKWRKFNDELALKNALKKAESFMDTLKNI